MLEPVVDVYSVRFDATLEVRPLCRDHLRGSIAVIAACEQPTVPGENRIVLMLIGDLPGLRERNQALYRKPLAAARNVLWPISGKRFANFAKEQFGVANRFMIWVYRDPAGHFQMVYPSDMGVEVRPLRSISGVPAGSQQAFLEVFPALGPHILDELSLYANIEAAQER